MQSDGANEAGVARWAVGTPYKLSFFSTLPDRTREVARALRPAAGREEIGITVNLGHPDLIVAYPVGGPGENLARRGTLPHLTGSSQVFAFDWVRTDGRQPSFLVPFTPGLDAGWCRLVSLVKLDPRTVATSGLEAEWRFLDGLCDLETGADLRISLLGTLSWPEVIVVITGTSLEAVFNHLYEVFRRTGSSPPTVHRTLTFTCLAEGVLSEDQEEYRRAIPASFKDNLVDSDAGPAATRPSDPVLVSHVQVNSATIAAPELVRRLQDDFQDVQYTLGGTDLVCRPAVGQTWEQFLWKVLRLRDQDTLVASTRLVVGRRLPREEVNPEASDEAAPSPTTVELTEADVEVLSSLSVDVREGFARVVYAFCAAARDRLVASAVWDLIPFVRKMVEFARRKTGDRADEARKVRFLDRHVVQLKLGLEQRLAGVPSAMEHPSSRTAFVHGPMNRAFIAIEELNRHVVEEILGRPTWGFVTVRPSMGRFASDVQVVEVPASCLQDLGQMLPILHEAVHCAEEADDDGIFHYDSPAFLDLLRFLDIPMEDRPQFRSLVSDIGADVFVVERCLGGDLDIYLRSLAPDLQNALDSGLLAIAEALTVRIGAVYLSHLMLWDPGTLREKLADRAPISPGSVVNDLVQLYFNWLESNEIPLPDVPASAGEEGPVLDSDLRVLKKRAGAALARLLLVLPWVHCCLDLDRGKEGPVESPRVGGEGEIAGNPSVVSPLALLVDALRSGASAGHRVTLAAYLTLWHQGVVRAGSWAVSVPGCEPP